MSSGRPRTRASALTGVPSCFDSRDGRSKRTSRGSEGRKGKEGQGRQEGSERVTQAIYLVGRFGQLVGMWILLVDVFTAGPLGPNPRLFAAGVAVCFSAPGGSR